MTTANTSAKTPKSPSRFRLPDPPQREPDEMTQFDHLFKIGTPYHLALHFGKPETTLVEADRWIVANPEFNKSRARRPDLLIAFDVDPVAYEASNGYVVSEQGKPPDFVLEVASESTAETDVVEKREEYAALGIPEYWRFDKTGEYHGAQLAGDSLVDGRYLPIEIEELSDGILQGHSEVLKLYLRWERGQLAWYEPETGRPIANLEAERHARIQAETRAEAAEISADVERESRIHAEARVRELEEQLSRLQDS